MPLQGYGKLVELQMKVDKLNDQVKDLTRLETINGKSYATKISDLQSKISTLKSKIDSEAQSYKMSKKTTKEVVVVFDKYSKRKQCLKEYEPYSKIDCKGGSMPDEMKLNHKHSFKVSEAPETFETQLEYKDSPWILPGLYMLFVWAVVGIISAFTLYFMYAEIDSAYDQLVNESDCVAYSQTTNSMITYATATGLDKDEIYCYCSHNGYQRVQNDSDINSSIAGLKDFCSGWTDDYDYLNSIVVLGLFVTYAINFMITHGFRFLFTQSTIKCDKYTHRHMIVSISTFLYTAIFIGIMPGFVFEQSTHDQDRVWYLRAGNFIIMYFITIMCMQPFEYIIYYAIVKLYKVCSSGGAKLQKDLNKLTAGEQYDFSHKLGSLLGYTWIVYLYSSGVPMLMPLFCVYILTFFAFEKTLLLKFYSKMDPITCYLKGYLNLILILIFMTGCMGGISVFGNSDIFPTDYELTDMTVDGETASVFEPEARTFWDKLIIETGIIYMLLMLFCTLLYLRILPRTIFECLANCCYPSSKSLDSPLIKQNAYSMIQKDMLYHPNSYKFIENPKYKNALEQIKSVISENPETNQHLSVPNKDDRLDSPGSAGSIEFQSSQRNMNSNGDDNNNIYSDFADQENNEIVVDKPYEDLDTPAISSGRIERIKGMKDKRLDSLVHSIDTPSMRKDNKL